MRLLVSTCALISVINDQGSVLARFLRLISVKKSLKSLKGFLFVFPQEELVEIRVTDKFLSVQ